MNFQFKKILLIVNFYSYSFFYISRYLFFKKYLKKNCINKILDIGSGNGSCCKMLNFFNYNCDLLEPNFNILFLRHLKKNKLYFCNFEKFVCKKKYNLIILISVLDEISDKATFLNKVKSLAKKNTLIYIEVRNLNRFFVSNKPQKNDLTNKEYELLFSKLNLAIINKSYFLRPLNFKNFLSFFKTFMALLFYPLSRTMTGYLLAAH